MIQKKDTASMAQGLRGRIVKRSGDYWRVEAESLPRNHHLRVIFLLPREILCNDGEPLEGRLVRMEYQKSESWGAWKALEFVDEAA
jgi:hypothetical protein